MVHCCCIEQEKRTLQNNDFLICSRLMRHPLIELFHLSNLLQMPMTIEWSTLSSLPMSHVVVRGLAVVTTLIWSLSSSNNQPLHSSSSRLSSPLQNFLNHHSTIHLLAVPGPNALLVLRVVSAALKPLFNSNKKITRI